MTDNPKLERLARAYMDGRYCSFEGWKGDEEREDCIKGVRAILRELREPDEGMLEAAEDVRFALTLEENGDIGQTNDNTEATWQAIIDHLLGEDK